MALIRPMVMLLNSRPAPPGSLMASCRPAPSESISSIKKENRFSSSRLREHPLDVFASGPNPAVEQFRSGDVFEVEFEFAGGRSSQKGLAGSTRAVQQNSVSQQAVAFVFSRFQMPLHHLADLLLRVIHSADVGKPLGRHIANYLKLLYLRPR